jgi:hypothetical protein
MRHILFHTIHKTKQLISKVIITYQAFRKTNIKKYEFYNKEYQI